MSHQSERKEKNCLNCGTIVAGRYCQNCGQENIDTRESFWSLTKHFVFDVLHFDGNFFYTLKYLFTRPGFVARQYAEGKRASYLHPIRMYLFTSAIFFVAFFAIERVRFKDANQVVPLSREDRLEMAATARENMQRHPGDSFYRKRLALLEDTSKPVTSRDLEGLGRSSFFSVGGGRHYTSLEQYDSIQKKLPRDKRDGWLVRGLNRKGLKMGDRYAGRENEGAQELSEAFLHRLPYLLFVSLPFFALLLKLLYVRRKNFYYSDHAVFTLYHYIFSFLLLLLAFGIGSLRDWAGWSWLVYLRIPLIIAWPVYLFAEMKYFYRQSSGKTVLKFLLLNFMGLVLLVLLFLVFLILSIFQM